MAILKFKQFNEGKNWIQDADMKKGALHKALGYEGGDKIPASILNKIASAKIGTNIKVKGKEIKVTNKLKKEANLAKTLSKMKKDKED